MWAQQLLHSVWKWLMTSPVETVHNDIDKHTIYYINTEEDLNTIIEYNYYFF